MKASSSTGSSMATPVSRPTDVRAGSGFSEGTVWGRAPERPSSESSQRRNHPHRYAPVGQVLLCLPDRVLAEVEDRGGQDGAGSAVGQALVEMVEGTDPPTGDDRDTDGLAHRPEQVAVI